MKNLLNEFRKLSRSGRSVTRKLGRPKKLGRQLLLEALEGRLVPTIVFPPPLRIAWRPTGGPSAMAVKIPRPSPCSGIPPAAT